jgi:hypothetical protein
MSVSALPVASGLPARSGRLIEVDFFRGIVLLMIVVDHIGASVLSRVTLHAFALCDAAEVFVFLGGFATASAYGAIADRHGRAPRSAASCAARCRSTGRFSRPRR